MHRLTVRGEELLAKVRELIQKGNVRRIVVTAEGGETIMELPVTAGVVGAVLAPALVAIGAIAAMAKHYTIVIDVGESRTVRIASTRRRPRKVVVKV
jgi:hypothetical protein